MVSIEIAPFAKKLERFEWWENSKSVVQCAIATTRNAEDGDKIGVFQLRTLGDALWGDGSVGSDHHRYDHRLEWRKHLPRQFFLTVGHLIMD